MGNSSCRQRWILIVAEHAADPTGYAAFASEAEDFVITDSCVIVFTKDKGLLRFPRL